MESGLGGEVKGGVPVEKEMMASAFHDSEEMN